jgi:hypothetical protein
MPPRRPKTSIVVVAGTLDASDLPWIQSQTACTRSTPGVVLPKSFHARSDSVSDSQSLLASSQWSSSSGSASTRCCTSSGPGTGSGSGATVTSASYENVETPSGSRRRRQRLP